VAAGDAFGVVVGEPLVGVDRWLPGPAGSDFEVEVGAGGLSGGADIADVLPGGGGHAFGDVDAVLPHVRVVGRDPFSADGVLDDDDSAPVAGVSGVGDDPIGDGVDRGAVGGGEVAAGVKRGLVGDRVGAPPEWTGPHPGALRQREHDPGGL